MTRQGSGAASAQFFSAAEILSAKSPDLPSSLRSIQRLLADWQGIDGKARRRGGRAGEWEYCASLLPQTARMKLALFFSSPANDDRDAGEEARKALWARFERLPDGHKGESQARLDAISAVEALTAGGMRETAAVEIIAAERGFAKSSYWNWKKRAGCHERADRLAALAPAWQGSPKRNECHPDAWQMLLDDYLRLSEPKFLPCYRRVVRVAKKKGWEMASPQSLMRRIKAEVDPAIVTLKRKGREKTRQMLPAQRRTVAGLHAMQAVNMDGHKLDVFTQWPGIDNPVRPILIGIQDVYSRKIVAWRLSDSENRETVRLAIGDMVENFGIPELWTLDNGRAFASKWISGGFTNRFRFKVKEEDPQGLLKSLGIGLHWTIPGRGQSKPIERAWGDLAEAISRHPLCDGAYTGNNVLAKPENYMSRAIPRETLLALCTEEIAAHNARPGRRTETAAGGSFDAAFNRSYSNSVITKASEGQKSLWLLAAERIRAQKGSGMIAFMGNRYHDSALHRHAGKDVTIRFDPDRLHQALRVYDAKDRFICAAAIIDDTGFYDRTGARLRAKDESAFLKVKREEARLIVKMEAETLGRLYLANGGFEEQTPQPKARRMAGGGARSAALRKEEALPQMHEAMDVESAFAAGLKLIHGGRES